MHIKDTNLMNRSFLPCYFEIFRPKTRDENKNGVNTMQTKMKIQNNIRHEGFEILIKVEKKKTQSFMTQTGTW